MTVERLDAWVDASDPTGCHWQLAASVMGAHTGGQAASATQVVYGFMLDLLASESIDVAPSLDCFNVSAV